VIVLVVDDLCVGPNKFEGDTPVATDPDRPSALARAFERVKSEPRKAHIFGMGGCVQAAQDQTQPFSVLRLNARFRSGLKEAG